jgi:16S rRNA (cytosine1402-N4)-methyltransferase
MQLDNPARGFSLKLEGPLDMRMNPNKGQSAAAFLQKVDAVQLGALLFENSDEPHAELLGRALAGQSFATTVELSRRIQARLSARPAEERELSVRRVFQALRIAVNDEWAALDTLLRSLPECVGPGGRIAVLTFHSGEDRRVKKAFEAGLRAGVFQSGERLHALNRPEAEDDLASLAATSVSELFEGLDFKVLSDTLESTGSLTREVWRTFLMAMALALLGEAILCMPPRRTQETPRVGGIFQEPLREK